LPRRSNRLVAEDECYTEAAATRTQIDDISLFDFEAKRPAVFFPDDFHS
jgi:hypothetical protein